MGFFDSLFRKPDPTRDWPSGSGTPSVNPASRSLGFVRLGDSLDAARTLGRPDRFVRHGEGFYTLSYASRGFAIEFEEGRLVEIACFIGPGGRVMVTPRASRSARRAARSARAGYCHRWRRRAGW